MKIAFICDLPSEHFPFWNDGLKAALDVLRDTYHWDIDVYNGNRGHGSLSAIGEIAHTFNLVAKYDIGLFWGGLTNPICNTRIFPKQALLFGGGPTHHENVYNFDHVFAESEVDYFDFKRFGISTSQAFGTNTKLFRPMPEQPKIYLYVYPAAFAKWKHHEKFGAYVLSHGENVNFEYTDPSLAFGYMQPNGWEKECYEVCQKHGIAVMPQVPYDVMPYIINAAQNVYVGADIMGGCQRTILEAKACNVNVVVDSDSPKLLELADLTHEDVLRDWSEESYAKKLNEKLTALCKTN